jgi:hypothetical protein
MDKYYVVIAGNGVTSRANLEALMEDHFYAKGADGVLHVVEDGKLSQGKTYATQLATDKGKAVVNYGLTDALEKADKANAVCFILWSDEDAESQQALAIATQLGVQCYDLTDGLHPLNPVTDVKPIVDPVIPEKESLTVVTPEIDAGYVEPADEDDTEEEDEDDEEDFDELDTIYYGIEAIAKVFAKAIVDEMENRKKGV